MKQYKFERYTSLNIEYIKVTYSFINYSIDKELLFSFYSYSYDNKRAFKISHFGYDAYYINENQFVYYCPDSYLWVYHDALILATINDDKVLTLEATNDYENFENLCKAKRLLIKLR